MRPGRRALAVVLLPGLIALVGVAWFMLVEGWSLLDAAYMVAITITTVGYEEVRPLDTGGRIFTLIYIPIAVGALLYGIGLMVEDLVLGRVADAFGLQRLGRRMERMRKHTVICGYGRVGREVSAEMSERGEDLVIIDQDPAAVAAARANRLVAIEGDATDENVLRRANIELARVIVAAADSDAENTFITLTARALNRDVMIIARAASDSGERRLRAAGADRVVSPAQIAGRRMALQAVQPLVVDFVDLFTRRGAQPNRMLAEVLVAAEAEYLAGHTVAEVFGTLSTCRLIAVEREEGEFLVGPPGGTKLRSGDRLMIVGETAELESLRPGGSGGHLVSGDGHRN